MLNFSVSLFAARRKMVSEQNKMIILISIDKENRMKNIGIILAIKILSYRAKKTN